MRIGPMRHRITIKQASTTQGATGQEVGTLTNIATNPTVWADVRPTTGQERFLSGGDQVQATLTHRVTIRYRSDLSVENVVVWDGKNLDIEIIQDPSGKRQYTVLMCHEVAA